MLEWARPFLAMAFDRLFPLAEVYHSRYMLRTVSLLDCPETSGFFYYTEEATPRERSLD